MRTNDGSLPSGKRFHLDFNLNHPTLLPGVQVITEESLLSGGKLFRPRLCFLFAEALGIPFERVAPYARIAELIHAATLSHDDVIDQATERRKKPTLNDRTTQARAVLAGDMMLSRAMVELCDLGNTELLRRMAQVLEDLVTGEWLQLENHGSLAVTEFSLDTIAKYKTSAMIEWCAQVSFFVSGSDAKTLELARLFGSAVGHAFQLVDDCVDFYPDSGKAFSHDLTEGLLNQVSLNLLQTKPQLASYFKEVMVHGLPIDRKSFVAAVGVQDLECAIATIKERAVLQISIANQTLDKLAALTDVACDFGHIRKAVESIVDRRK